MISVFKQVRNWIELIMVLCLQWNARSLLANGQEFKKFIEELPIKPDVICVQETWLKPNLDFRIVGYSAVRSDREVGVLHLFRKILNLGR